MRLREIAFADVYLGEASCWLGGGAAQPNPEPAPPDIAGELGELRALCVDTAKRTAQPEFAVRHDGIYYRASTLRSLHEVVYVLRRMPERVPRLMDLGLLPAHMGLLLRPGLTGLVVISGAYGQGKTTTASSLVAERLARNGGVCVTVEDPPEMPLEGQHGEGVCYQTWSEQGKFGDSCRHAARWTPSILFVGEVRDAETATEALRASVNGSLVICTTHADNVIGTVDRLFALANGRAGSGDDVSGLLSNGLACVLHQRLVGEPKRPSVEFLWLRGEESVGARAMIRNKRFDQLGTEITLQANRLKMAPQASRGTA